MNPGGFDYEGWLYNIALVAGLVYFLTQRVWRLMGLLCLALPALRAAAIVGLIAGFVYALLAGFSIPTQRAAIMLAAVMVRLSSIAQ
jgi:competence protein ComEC